MTDSGKLAIIHPMRDGVKDIKYIQTQEFAYCEWCKYHKTRFVSNGMKKNDCYNRYITKKPQDVNASKECRDANPEGKCIHYEPSLFTRVARFFWT